MSRSACAIDKDVVPASFKGVGFWCTDADIEGGRRGAEGEFPFGENTAYADLGRKIRVFHLTAVFREDNHVGDASALFMACESTGPGLLVHPTRGTHMVACRSVKVSDKLEEAAGETTAELEFVEANIGFGGLAGSIFGILSSGLFAESQTTFLSEYTPILVPHPWIVNVVDKAQGLIAVTSISASHSLTADSASSEWREILHMNEVANDDGLAISAKIVNKVMVDGFNIISANVQDPGEKFTKFRRLANASSSSSKLPAGPAADSEEAVLSRHRVLSAIGMAESALGRKYKTIDENQEAMNIVLAVLDDEARLAFAQCFNALFLEIKKYATEFSKMMNDLSYRLPGQVLVNFSGGVHPLVASYVIYKDSKRHRELEERNIIDANGRFGPIVSGISPT